jgi:hypothetical protein
MVRKKKKAHLLVKGSGLANGNPPPPVDISDVDFADYAISCSLNISADSDLHLDLGALHTSLMTAPDTYTQLKVLQLYRSHLKIILAGAEPMRNIVALPSQQHFWLLAQQSLRFVFRLFLYPPMKNMHKTILPILETLVLLDTAFPHLHATEGLSMGDILGDELARFVDQLPAVTDTTTDGALVALDQLHAILDFHYFADAIWLLHGLHHAHYTTLLRFCVVHLKVLSAPIAQYQTTQRQAPTMTHDSDDTTTKSQSSAEVVYASERCQSLLKSIIILCTVPQKKSAVTVTLAHTPLLPSKDTSEVELCHVIKELIDSCALILNNPVVPKDLLTQVGLALLLLVKLHHDITTGPPSSTSPLFHTQVLSWMFPHISFDMSSGPPPTLPCLSGPLLSSVKTWSPTSQLSVYRGFVNCISDDVLALPVIMQKHPSSLDNDHANVSLREFFFSTVLTIACAEPNTDLRLYAFQVLEMFLRRWPPNQAVREASLQALVDAIFLNWEHPSKKINQFMPTMFSHVLPFVVMHPTQKGLILDRILIETPDDRRAKYHALTLLLPHVSALALVQSRPEFLPHLLQAVRHQDVSASAATLFVHVVDTLEIELWVYQVTTGLLSHDVNLRTRLSTYVLPNLVKSKPTCVSILLDALRAAPGT